MGKFLTLSEFDLEGQFLGFVNGASKERKYLQLAIASGEVRLKLPPELRNPLGTSLESGELIRIFGVSKLNTHTGKIKFKVYGVKPLGICPKHQIERHLKPKAKILVCQKSGCKKRGGQGLISELEKTLCEHGLRDRVEIETTGCQKRCGSAPNCIVKLGKKEYKKMQPEAIASLLSDNL
ncbi:(2Fe-2S) ferredoxin domain-containing protein [Calothrix sp. 336/3]|uniref:(2Fe-2S) ferredoxin domain-containing protein n=1 Tax=Calothrix sp. 336/3 TaxID=1337936 RepID=UPI0004E35829|nr:(2Fe-2S) ferredoxin domain-containing protein [Calothrix sp. 336/3]AKG24150.1 DNA-binding protein [Calothrix sp. 336/3]